MGGQCEVRDLDAAVISPGNLEADVHGLEREVIELGIHEIPHASGFHEGIPDIGLDIDVHALLGTKGHPVREIIRTRHAIDEFRRGARPAGIDHPGFRQAVRIAVVEEGDAEPEEVVRIERGFALDNEVHEELAGMDIAVRFPIHMVFPFLELKVDREVDRRDLGKGNRPHEALIQKQVAPLLAAFARTDIFLGGVKLEI